MSQRRVAPMGEADTAVKGSRRLMIVIGEVKEVAQSRYGHKIVFKHLPDCHFMMNDDLHKRLLKRFEVELGLWDALEDTHLMAIGTFSVGNTGIASLEEVALMSVTENWIPFESTFDQMVIDAMSRANRRFMKGMRYNLPSNRPLACLVASDTLPEKKQKTRAARQLALLPLSAPSTLTDISYTFFRVGPPDCFHNRPSDPLRPSCSRDVASDL
ncbi:DUF1173 family protein, partial [Pseudomonas aeruginosa]|nr:DUF1173 family protein [Pseudomonas aeruginosa]